MLDVKDLRKLLFRTIGTLDPCDWCYMRTIPITCEHDKCFKRRNWKRLRHETRMFNPFAPDIRLKDEYKDRYEHYL